MIVSELKKLFANLPDDAEVRLAIAPAYPMEYSIGTVVATDPTEGLAITRQNSHEWYIVNEAEDPQDEAYWVWGPRPDSASCEEKLDEMSRNHEAVVYISEDTQLGYLKADGLKAVGW